MKEIYEYAPSVEFPNLFFEISEELRHLLNHYNLDHSKAEICFLKQEILKDLKEIGITQKTYNGNFHFDIKSEAIFIKINSFYNTYHSKADL